MNGKRTWSPEVGRHSSVQEGEDEGREGGREGGRIFLTSAAMNGKRTWSPEKGRQPSVQEGEEEEDELDASGEEEDEEGREEGSLTRCLGRLRMTISPS